MFGKILVADDSITELQLISALLMEYGFVVVTAMDGQEALEKVFTEWPQCIILDVVMPRKNGFQVCRQLKRFPGSRHLPIILLSQKCTPLDRSWGLQQGANLYMTKPFEREELVRSVLQLL